MQARVKSLCSEEEKLSLQEELQAHITALEKWGHYYLTTKDYKVLAN